MKHGCALIVLFLVFLALSVCFPEAMAVVAILCVCIVVTLVVRAITHGGK